MSAAATAAVSLGLGVLGAVFFWLWMLIFRAKTGPDDGNHNVAWTLIVVSTRLMQALTYYLWTLLFNHMVKYSDTVLDDVFHVLSDSTRRGILEQLAEGELSVSELAEPYEISLPAISKHLRILESAGLLRQELDGRIRRCRLDAGPLEDASNWIFQYRRYWELQLDSLANYLLQGGQPWDE